ncbi:MAG: WD40 repeat domain-containing protein [Candidatus Heimdallarchaeota archaeon]|nr:WD40 repeat domain-containing protein [Candidatus Heimdallarchaeota archaeon]
MIIQAHDGQVLDLKFTKNSKVLISAGKDHSIKFWEAPNWEFRFELAGHSERVNVLSLKENENLLFSGSDDKTIKVWDLEERKEILSFTNDKTPVISLEISPEEELLASRSNDGSVKLYCLESMDLLVELKDSNAETTCLSYPPDSSYMLTGSKDNKISIWDIPQGKLRKYISSKIVSPIYIMHFDKGKKIFIAGKDGNINILETKDWSEEKSIKLDQANYNKMLISPNERYIVAINDSIIQLWLLSTGEKITEYKLKSKGIVTVIFSPNTKYLAIGCADNNILIYNLDIIIK